MAKEKPIIEASDVLGSKLPEWAECIVSTESSEASAELLETYLIGRAGL